MRLSILKNTGISFVIAIVALWTNVSVSTAEGAYAKEGNYLGVMMPYNTIGGDFDGESVLTTPNEVLLIPKVQGSWGWGILFGRRFQKSAFEFSYLTTTHDVTWQGAKGKAVYDIVSMDYKRYFLTDEPVQPYFLIGWLPYANFKVHDGAATSTSVGDANFQAVFTGFNLGGGLAFYLHPRVALNAGVYYRLIYFTSAKGAGGDWKDMEEDLNGSGLNYNVGMSFTF